MNPATYHGVIRSGVVQLDQGVLLAEGTEVSVTPVASGIRNGPAIVAALDAAPKVPKEWVEELERLIEEGQRPPTLEDIFPDEADEKESA